MGYELNINQLENDLRAFDENSADIFDNCDYEFHAHKAWVEISKQDFTTLTNDATLWCKVGERQFGEGQKRFKWDLDANEFYILSFRSDFAPIKGWMRRVMKKVHAKRKYSQADIQRIAKIIRQAVTETK